MDDARLIQHLNALPLDRALELAAELPVDRRLRLAELDPGDDAEQRQQLWAAYLESIPFLICVALGGETDTVRDPEGRPVEVAPSYGVQLLALDVMLECGPGDPVVGDAQTVTLAILCPWSKGGSLRDGPCARCGIEHGPGRVRWTANAGELLAGLTAKIEGDLRSHLGLSLRQARYRWRSALRWGHVRGEARLGHEPPTLMERVLVIREIGRAAVGRREAAGG